MSGPALTAALCPAAAKPAKRVAPVTVGSLVRNEHAPEAEGREWSLTNTDAIAAAISGTAFKAEVKTRKVEEEERDEPGGRRVGP